MKIKSVNSLLVPVLILLAGAVAMNRLGDMRKEVPARPVTPKTRVVNVEPIEPATINARVTGWGRLNSARPLVLLSEAEGTLLAGDVPFQQGQGFAEGALLLRVDDRQKRLELSRSKSDFINAMATMMPDIQQQHPKEWKTWDAYFKRLRVDRPVPTMPVATVDRIKRLLARYNVYQLYYTMRNQEIALEKYRIRAPFKGTVVSADMRVGANVRSGTRLGEILSLQQLDLELQLPASDLPWVNRDGAVTLRSSQFPGQWQGRIDRIGSTVDQATQTVTVYIRLDEGEAPFPLLAGLLFEADLTGIALENAISIDTRNLYGDDMVYLLEDGKLAKREVTVARREIDRVLVTAGLEPGEQLVIDLLEGVAEGMKAMSVDQFAEQAEQP
jgi:multidrug efflux pump subunit AcrA (membrane-fusion protein)